MQTNYYRYIRTLIAFRTLTIVLTVFALILPMFLVRQPSWSIGISLFALLFLILMSIFDRNYYLRFLNRSVFPTGLLVEKEKDEATRKKEGFTESFKMSFPQYKDKKIVYWASKKGDFDNPREAYEDYKNSGVANTDENGVAELHLREVPGTYVVPYKGQLKPHIHYRALEINGMLGEVKTVFL